MNLEKKKALKRQTILKAATACFENRSYDEVTLDEVATEAGVGKGTVYLYFRSKEDLFLQLAVEGVDEMVAQVKELTQMTALPFVERFERIILALAGFFMRRHGFIRLMNQAMSEQLNEGFCRHREQMRNAMMTFIGQGVKEGALRRDCDVAELEMMLIGPLVFRARNQGHSHPVSPEVLSRLIWSAIKHD
ncbi:TetR/AcrR family transcriptional regulator [Kiritimatiellota bacterium B12222]|nr:TetR/AcrR family transcriptional regulator [Kiritimatiellota bacterium B12222]